MIYTLIASTGIAVTAGCGLIRKIPPGPHDTTKSYHDNYGLRIEYPEVAECATPQSVAAQQTSSPYSLQDPSQIPALEITLDQAVQQAVQQSPVLRNIGGAIVNSAQGSRTIYDPALAAVSPSQGTEAALAAFDAQLASQLFWSNVDQPINRRPFDGGTFIVVPTSITRQCELHRIAFKTNRHWSLVRVKKCSPIHQDKRPVSRRSTIS